MQKVKPKKSLGQHFLTDTNIAGKIAHALSGENYNSIVEIGPGTGVLTDFLITSQVPFHAIEIDKESIAYLQKKYPEKNFIVEDDVLKADFSRFTPPLAIIGNLPYYISSQIFFRVIELKDSVSEVVCMIQKEVAERIAAPPGNKTFGILSVFLQTWFDIEYLFTVHENCFHPPPKVKSAVIRLTRNNRTAIDCDEKLFYRIVKQGFNQRRKTLRNSLKNICLNLDTSRDVFNKRPEQLDVETFILLAKQIDNCISNQQQ
ncbi:MAG TPA: 16S rRNA (adenine(1518)-N(6)/adenine(1519)-N(6))-dimethyltransferase [Bacteroidales bacterium]|nr:16S rRNA (adenine(1518)-N(6)/adenine(1519)-N(6))-dimethyltransferase [Bacteroidales bacterium]